MNDKRYSLLVTMSELLNKYFQTLSIENPVDTDAVWRYRVCFILNQGWVNTVVENKDRLPVLRNIDCNPWPQLANKSLHKHMYNCEKTTHMRKEISCFNALDRKIGLLMSSHAVSSVCNGYYICFRSFCDDVLKYDIT